MSGREYRRDYATTEVSLLWAGCLSVVHRIQAHVRAHGQPTLPPEPVDDTLRALLGVVALARRLHRFTPAPQPVAREDADEAPRPRPRSVLR